MVDVSLPRDLLSYYERVGAEVMNFRRAMIRHFRGNYYVERCLIEVGADGEVTCRDPEYAPTEEERAAIRAAFASGDYRPPRSIPTTLSSAADHARGLRGTVHQFLSSDRSQVIMLQERWLTDAGEKVYMAWSFFDDGEWRRMEPDGPLPFWKPRDRSELPRIMVHEGAKAAAAAEAIARDQGSTHPWAREFAEFEHWGIIGGALAPHRSDYEELWRERPTEVVYFCDNDEPGRAAIRGVSQCYRRRLKAVMLDEKWPNAWDVADPVPASLFKNGRYIGPSLREVTNPATWATEQHKPERGKPAWVLKQDFVSEWYHSVLPEAYVHREWPARVYSMTEFNNRMRPFSNVDDVARLLKAHIGSKGLLLKYSPAAPAGIYVGDGERCLNTHVGTSVPEVEGDAAPFLTFLRHLVPAELDRRELLRWIATLVARPEVKMTYGVLLISETQGVGKGTLGEKMLAPLVGKDNVSTPSEAEIVESHFNYWAAHKRLAVVHEIYAGHSSKAYNKLKSLITDDRVTVNKKYQPTYDIDNWIHILACSNSRQALRLSMDDRRWFVPTVTEERREGSYWRELNSWLSEGGGLGIMRRWLREQVEADPNMMVMRGDVAPWTRAKKDMVEEGWSDGMKVVAKVLSAMGEEAGDRTVVLLDTELVKLIKNVVYEGRTPERLERPLTIRKVAKASGWHIGESRIEHHRWGTLDCFRSHVITNDFHAARESIPDLMRRATPVDVAEMSRRIGF